MDFGSVSSDTSTNGNWNNIALTSLNQSNLNYKLIDINDNYTGITLNLDDSFDLVNNSGTQNPDNQLPFTSSATRDSFFGETNPFNGNTNPTGGFSLYNLDPTKYYSFSVFSSRMGVSDNRETLYTITGQNTIVNTLNPSNNTTNTADIYNVQPTSSGIINFEATAGTNNNNTYGFYYLGAIKMVESSSPISTINDPYLLLNYPNGDEFWEVGKTTTIAWQSFNTSNIDIDYSTDNGISWNTITTVNASINKYDWVVPSNVSNQCLVRINSNSTSDISNANFSIINDDGVNYKIIILGSSTAAGTGPAFSNNAWVARYRYYLQQKDTRFEVENLAVGGFTTYNILPTGTQIPTGVSHNVDVAHNITKALSLNPDGIIINLPSNDAAFNYLTANQITNYNLIKNTALAENVPVWISSPQPKNFGTDTTGLQIQLEMVTETPIQFGEFAFDFWADLGVSDNNGIKPEYNTDGTHMNDTGHRELFERVISKGIHTVVKNQVESNLSTTSINNEFSTLNIYPNPVEDNLFINFRLNSNSFVKIQLFTSNGFLVSDLINEQKAVGNHTIKINAINNKVTSGIYILKTTTNTNTFNTKILLK